ncbi:MAG: DUF5664 domain-containing protein [Thermoguttaceae bacterium]|nr:DUF5664 domain-containing protein [Thermoguttaceae bacterium]
MKDDLILFPKDMTEPEPGEIIQAKDGYWYLCVLGTDCADCDIDCEDTSTCEYKPICSCFKRKEFSSVVFRYIRNLSDVAKVFTKEDKTNDPVPEQQPDDFCQKPDECSLDDCEHFETGAVRDSSEGKPRPELISPFATDRLALWLALGAKKYSTRNWEKGIPFSRCFASLHRHLMRYQEGDRSEDHLAAAYCNLMFCLHFEEMIKRGLLSPSLLDLPLYKNISYDE